MAIMQYRRATAASMFQDGISRNTKCDNLVGFLKSGHIYVLRPQALGTDTYQANQSCPCYNY